MPGQPKWHAFLAQMEREGGDEVVIDRVADGQTLASLARELGVSRWTLRRYLQLTNDRWARYQEALRESAGALAEQAQEIADAADARGAAGVQKAKMEVQAIRWLASVRDPVAYGNARSKSLPADDIGSMHLRALLAHGAPEAQAALPAPPEQEEEIEEAEPVAD